MIKLCGYWPAGLIPLLGGTLCLPSWVPWLRLLGFIIVIIVVIAFSYRYSYRTA
jgi:membrane protein implicated in regulation of membrane protease activity